MDFIISCSILEIYKETLRDLLNEDKILLKIKESPTKGIYVDNLT
jgi:kinesin family protein 5